MAARGQRNCLAVVMIFLCVRELSTQEATSTEQAPVLGPPTPSSPTTQSDRQFRVVYEWNMMDFAYASEDERAQALYRGEYVPRNVIISDCKPYANRLYVTIPRMLAGVPATLGYFVRPDNNGRTDPEIEPFPSWQMNKRGNCSALQFVQGIAIDKFGIMWVVDSGRTETLHRGTNHVTCPPKLLLLDLKRNGTVVWRYEFPEDVVPAGMNYLNKIVVDDAFGGFAYITDNSGGDPGIVVYSRRLNRSWKVRENNSMRAAQNAVRFGINGTELNFSIHIDGIALGPFYNPHIQNDIDPHVDPLLANQNYERNVYYSPLSSYHLYSLPASLLRDPEFVAKASPRDILESVTDYGRKMSQTDGMIMDNQGELYYGLLGEHAIARWDSYLPFTPKNQIVVAKDKTHIQWVDGMGFDHEGYLYVVVNRLHNFVAGKLNSNEVNFRILRAKTGALSYVDTPDNVFNNDLKYRYDGEVDNSLLNYGISSTTPISSRLETAGVFSSKRSGAAQMSVSVLSMAVLALVAKLLAC
ncbi:protein yellow-like [Uranotaenia lowii]|uniref:protein yellow-like n=1 Tax=Uranotaenia lowii TaxID=190385 RepID=UPI0024795678|nr:protein yellow-like [Uranotaenia lowii]